MKPSEYLEKSGVDSEVIPSIEKLDKKFVDKKQIRKELKEKVRLRDCWKAHEFDKIIDEVLK